MPIISNFSGLSLFQMLMQSKSLKVYISISLVPIQFFLIFLCIFKGTFSCTQCNTTFNSELALRTHMKTHKAESERKYHCRFDGCGKSFNFAHHLKHHELTHTDTKQFFCKECGKGRLLCYTYI